jgi:peptidoglycan/xylan/chitin deacetylase (PgdA/CDA1 family)
LTTFIFLVVRPPYGNSDKHVTKVLNHLGYTVVNWSVDSKDYETHRLSSEMHNYHRGLGPSDDSKGGIGLEHDVSFHIRENNYLKCIGP